MDIKELKEWAVGLDKSPASELDGAIIAGIATVQVAIAIKELGEHAGRIADALDKLARTPNEILTAAFVESLKPEAIKSAIPDNMKPIADTTTFAEFITPPPLQVGDKIEEAK